MLYHTLMSVVNIFTVNFVPGDTAYQVFRSLAPCLPHGVGSLASLNKLQYLKLYYSTRLSHLHCHYPLHACTLEREITTV
jgi:hypothetical protein